MKGVTTMSAHRKSWDEVGKKFEAVGAQFRRLIDEANEDVVADRAAFEKAIHALFSALDDSLEATSRIVRDPVLRNDLTELAGAVRDAVKATVEGAREQLSAATPVRGRKALKTVAGKVPARTSPSTKKPVRPAAPRNAPHRPVSGKPSASKRP
jgi:hypothetical protein